MSRRVLGAPVHHGFAAAQQAGVMDLIEDRALIEAFSIDDPQAWEPPRAWPDAPMDNQREVIAAGEEVKSS